MATAHPGRRCGLLVSFHYTLVNANPAMYVTATILADTPGIEPGEPPLLKKSQAATARANILQLEPL